MKPPILQALLVSLALSALGLILVAWGVGGPQSLLRVARLDPVHLLLAIAALFASFALAALRLQLICRLLGGRLRHRHALRAHILGMFGAAVTPGGSGGMPAVAFVLDLQGIERARAWAASLALISADALFHAWATPVALAVLYGLGLYPRSPQWLALAMVAIVATAALAYLLLFRIDWLRPLAGKLLRGPLLPFRRRGLRFVDRFLAANVLVAHAPLASRLVLQALTAIAWALLFMVLVFLLWGLGVRLGVLTALAGQTVILVLSSFVPTPGASGFFELALSWFLVRQGSGDAGPAAVFAWRLLTFYSLFLLGPLLGGYMVLRHTLRQPRDPQRVERRVEG